MEKRNKLSLKGILAPTVSLLLICLFTTGILAVVNAMTEGPIAANMAAQADSSRQEIFPGARFLDNGDYFTALEPSGALLGYSFETQGKGYGGAIHVTVGLDPDGNILKVQVVAADDETPGLGQRVREAGFLNQFIGKSGALSLGKDVDGVTGATYSSQGVVDAVNAAQQIYEGQVKGGAEE